MSDEPPERENLSRGSPSSTEEEKINNGEDRETCYKILSNNTNRNSSAKMIFKKEFEGSNEANKRMKPIIKSWNKSDGKELIDMSKLLALKPTFLNNNT